MCSVRSQPESSQQGRRITSALTPFPGYVGPAGLLLTSPSPNVARMPGRPQTAMPLSAGRSLHPRGAPRPPISAALCRTVCSCYGCKCSKKLRHLAQNIRGVIPCERRSESLHAVSSIVVSSHHPVSVDEPTWMLQVYDQQSMTGVACGSFGVIACIQLQYLVLLDFERGWKSLQRVQAPFCCHGGSIGGDFQIPCKA